MEISSNQKTHHLVFQALESTFSDMNGIRIISELAFSILYLLQETLEKVPQPIVRLCSTLDSFINISYVTSFFNRIHELVEQDEDGKYLWDYSNSYIASSLTLCVASTANIIWLLDELGCYVLGKVWNPIICHISTVFTTLSTLFEAIYYYEEIGTGNETITKAEHCAKIWKERSQRLTDAQIDEIIEKWQKKFSEKPEDERISRICTQWQAIKSFPNERATYCELKAKNWQTMAENQKINNTQNWINLALCVVDVALSIIWIIFPTPAHALAVALLSIGVLENAVCVVAYMMGHLWVESPLHKIPFPGTSQSVKELYFKPTPLEHHFSSNSMMVGAMRLA